MMTLAEATSAVEVINKHLNPALEALDEKVRQGRRLIVRGRHTAEDSVAAAALQVRRHPLSTVLIAAAAGVLVGGLLGLVLGSKVRLTGDY